MLRPLLSDEEYLHLLGPALRYLRQRIKLRQYVVAERAGITKAMYSGYETGKQVPSLGTLLKVLAALKANLTTLEEAIYAVQGLLPPERVSLPILEEPQVQVRMAEDGTGEVDIKVGGIIRLKLTSDSGPSLDSVPPKRSTR